MARRAAAFPPLRRKSGRPRNPPATILTGLRVPRPRGRRIRYTREIELLLVTAIDSAKLKARAAGTRLGDVAALRAHMRMLFAERFIAAGYGPLEARRLANEEARQREQSLRFRKKLEQLRERLSRIRSRRAAAR